MLTLVDLVTDKIGQLCSEELERDRSVVSDLCIEFSPWFESLDSLLIAIFGVEGFNEERTLLGRVPPAPCSC